MRQLFPTDVHENRVGTSGPLVPLSRRMAVSNSGRADSARSAHYSAGWRRLRTREAARPYRAHILPGEMPQSLAQLRLAQDQIADDFLKVIAEFRCQSVTGVTHLLDNRVFERWGWLRVLRECRLVGIHVLGFH
jgi:hypothetical protein